MSSFFVLFSVNDCLAMIYLPYRAVNAVADILLHNRNVRIKNENCTVGENLLFSSITFPSSNAEISKYTLHDNTIHSNRQRITHFQCNDCIIFIFKWLDVGVVIKLCMIFGVCKLLVFDFSIVVYDFECVCNNEYYTGASTYGQSISNLIIPFNGFRVVCASKTLFVTMKYSDDLWHQF